MAGGVVAGRRSTTTDAAIRGTVALGHAILLRACASQVKGDDRAVGDCALGNEAEVELAQNPADVELRLLHARANASRWRCWVEQEASRTAATKHRYFDAGFVGPVADRRVLVRVVALCRSRVPIEPTGLRI